MLREWVGGRVPMPAYVMDGEPYRPDLILWLELPDDLIVGSTVIDPKAPPVGVGQVLLDAMKRPLAGRPRRPHRVRVADEGLADEVRSVVPGTEVVVAPTPELRAIVDLMAEQMSAGDAKASYLEGGRVPADAVARLFRAAEALWEVAPWKVASDGQVVRVDIPQLGLNGACLSIIGNLGESLGLLLFPSADGYRAFLEAAEHRRKPLDLGTTMLSLEFDRGADLPASLRREVARHGWPVASPDAYPRVEHRDPDGRMRPHSERDLRVMARVAEALAPFFLKHRELFVGDRPEPVCESYYDEDDVEVRFTIPYDAHDAFEISDAPATPRRAGPKAERNAPCPCGSGRKYKKCCLPKDEAAATPDTGGLHRMDQRLFVEMMRFAEERFGAAFRRSRRDFTDAESAQQLHRPWSIYGFHVEGRSVVAWFLDERGARLRPEERGWLEAQGRSWLGIWEVLGVEPGRSVTVRDLLSGEKRVVRELLASKTLRARDTVLARVVDHGGLSVFAGTHPRPLTPWFADDVARAARRKLQAKTVVPIERLRDEGLGRHLIKRWERAVAEMVAEAQLPPVVQNTDGDTLLFTTEHFAFDRASRDEIVRLLAAMDGVVPPEGDGEESYGFLRVGKTRGRGQDDTLVGRAWLGEDDLRVETNSVRRADDLRRRVEEALGSRVRHRAREHADPLSPANRLPPDAASRETGIPPELQARLLREYKERHYAAWVDVPISALGGKTPRQAARTAAGRATLDLLLRDMENREARVPEEARFDLSRLRGELRLDR